MNQWIIIGYTFAALLLAPPVHWSIRFARRIQSRRIDAFRRHEAEKARIAALENEITTRCLRVAGTLATRGNTRLYRCPLPSACLNHTEQLELRRGLPASLTTAWLNGSYFLRITPKLSLAGAYKITMDFLRTMGFAVSDRDVFFPYEVDLEGIQNPTSMLKMLEQQVRAGAPTLMDHDWVSPEMVAAHPKVCNYAEKPSHLGLLSLGSAILEKIQSKENGVLLFHPGSLDELRTMPAAPGMDGHALMLPLLQRQVYAVGVLDPVQPYYISSIGSFCHMLGTQLYSVDLMSDAKPPQVYT